MSDINTPKPKEDSENPYYSAQMSIIDDYLSEMERNYNSKLESLEYDADDECASSWSDDMQGSFTDEEYFLSDENSRSSSDNRDTGEDLNIDAPEWNNDPDANELWSQPGSWTNALKEQPSHAWADMEGPQIEVDWDFQNKEVLELEPVKRKESIMIDTLAKLDAFLPNLSQLKDGVELALDCEGTPEKEVDG
ncbi:hypothetical protein DID88_007048 [Monilinia fructigena]|uniref:Uncharacterized protein n=1 Tax=Monilinia fructigena TaxID=38457 RepID=A0A395J853_9HELO|nr:hypothetical protein DID88_007048 [Monilinia fructigena]